MLFYLSSAKHMRDVQGQFYMLGHIKPSVKIANPSNRNLTYSRTILTHIGNMWNTLYETKFFFHNLLIVLGKSLKNHNIAPLIEYFITVLLVDIFNFIMGARDCLFFTGKIGI